MSDGRLGSEENDGDGGPARPTNVRLSGAGAAAAAGINGPASHPVQAPKPETNELGADDLQPMLDLRFPDPPAADTDALPASFEPRPAIGPDSLNSSPDRDRPDAESSPPVDMVVEVSPIFSALDAAEIAFARNREHAPAEAMPPDIMLPRPPSFAMGDEPPRTSAALDHAHPTEAEANSPAAPEDHPKSPADDRAEQLHDAAAKIADEANATAEALESLKRLLNHKLPLLDTMPPPTLAVVAPEPKAPPPMPVYEVPPIEPVLPPPMVPLAPTAVLAEVSYNEPPRHRAGIAVGGFLAGFALSWVFGAVLYAYLTMG